MNIGVPKEVKNHEYRVAATPGTVQALVARGHGVCVESHAGEGSGYSDDAYRKAGAQLGSAADAWAQRLVLKVKEPQPEEYAYLRRDLILFTYLHLAADKPLTEALLAARCSALAYETVQLPDGSLPLLTPMSEIAGRMAPLVGAYYLSKFAGGRGLLLSGVPGVSAGQVVILGGGVVGTQAATIALGMGAKVSVLDISHKRLAELDALFFGRVETLASTPANIAEAVPNADLLIGAVLVPGGKAPELISRELLTTMKAGSVIVDVAVDQGGCIASSRPTTHQDPTFVEAGVLHYGVSNMPGAVPMTSTQALCNETLRYVLHLAEAGLDACYKDAALALGLNTHAGKLTCQGVAQAFDLPYLPPSDALAVVA